MIKITIKKKGKGKKMKSEHEYTRRHDVPPWNLLREIGQ